MSGSDKKAWKSQIFKEKYILTASWEACRLHTFVLGRWVCELGHRPKLWDIYMERDSLGWTNALLCPWHIEGSAFTTTFLKWASISSCLPPVTPTSPHPTLQNSVEYTNFKLSEQRVLVHVQWVYVCISSSTLQILLQASHTAAL